MEFELKAGAKFDLLSPKEFRAEMDKAPAWVAELTRGVKFRPFGEQATITAAGTWSVQDEPRPGFIWGLTLLAISGPGYDPTTHRTSVFVQDTGALRARDVGIVSSRQYPLPGIVVVGTEPLIVTGTGTAGSTLTVAGQIVEVPVQVGWRLLG